MARAWAMDRFRLRRVRPFGEGSPGCYAGYWHTGGHWVSVPERAQSPAGTPEEGLFRSGMPVQV